MALIDSLKFVMSAVAKKDNVPALNHFVIENGYIKSFNGQLALAAPIALSFSCKPKAVLLYNALSECTGTIQLTLTPGGKLGVKSGAFRAYVDCFVGDTYDISPVGTTHQLNYANSANLLLALKTLYPFVGTDTVRLWSTGIMLTDTAALAGNNVIFAEVLLACGLPNKVNLPRMLVAELLRIGKEPSSIQLTDTIVTFHYTTGEYVRSQLLPTSFPNMSSLFHVDATPVPINKEFFDGLSALKPFVDKKSADGEDAHNAVVYFTPQGLSTSNIEETGAQYVVEGVPIKGAYNLNMLLLLKDIMKQADFSRYPDPMLFFGDNVRGAMVSLDY